MIKFQYDGYTWKISFSHILPEPTNPKLSRTQSSYKRPGTICSLTLLDKVTGEPIATYVQQAFLSPHDSFSYEEGRKHSLNKVLKDTFQNQMEFKKAVWAAYFSRRKPNVRKLIRELKPNDSAYSAKVNMLVNLLNGGTAVAINNIWDYARHCGFNVKPHDNLFAHVTK